MPFFRVLLFRCVLSKEEKRGVKLNIFFIALCVATSNGQ
jgi:hypothetical protein